MDIYLKYVYFICPSFSSFLIDFLILERSILLVLVFTFPNENEEIFDFDPGYSNIMYKSIHTLYIFNPNV